MVSCSEHSIPMPSKCTLCSWLFSAGQGSSLLVSLRIVKVPGGHAPEWCSQGDTAGVWCLLTLYVLSVAMLSSFGGVVVTSDFLVLGG